MTGRRKFSLTSYDSSRFDPEKIYRAMATGRTTETGISNEEAAVDLEIELMRKALKATSIQPQLGCSKDIAPSADSAIINTLLEEYHDMRAKVTTLNAKIQTLEAREHEFASLPSYIRLLDRRDLHFSEYNRDEIDDLLVES